MNYNVEQQTEKIRKKHRAKKMWHRVVSVLACITVFCTTYALVIPAITMTDEVYCGLDEHSEHTDECYELVPVCGYADSSQPGYSAEPICGQAENAHTHSDSCYTEKRELVCEEHEHIHSDTCYETYSVTDAGGNAVDELVLTCQEQEHTHGSSCYVTWQELTCTNDGHIHSDDCYPTLPAEEAHQHTEECYEKQLICEKEIHTHTLQCSSNPDADVENSAIWERTFADVTLTGNWSEDTLAIAQTQLGYSESEQNYQVGEDGATLHGYTRYGAWFGDPYGEWDAMFVAFCLSYAGVPESVIPYTRSCDRWVDALTLTNPENFYTVGIHQPTPGDLVFFDRDGDSYADHVGIVRAYNAAESSLSTIEAKRSGQVGVAFYQSGNADILGYFSLPKSSAETESEENAISYEALNGMLDELERMIQYGAFASVQSNTALPENEPDVSAVDAQDFYRKASAIEQAVEAAHDAASIAEDEYSELMTRLNDICEAFDFTASFAANAGSGKAEADIKVVPAPDYVGSIPSPGNSWQITKEEYTGREQNNKAAVDGDHDGTPDVYIQKNVVPTDTENEFLVYLSMDKKMTWEKFFDESGIYITTSNKYQNDPVGTVYEVDNIVGKASELMPNNAQGTYKDKYYVQFNVYETHSSASPIYSYYDWRYGDTPNCSNGTVFLKAPFLGYLVIGRSVNYKYSGGGTGNPFVVDIYLDEPSLSVDFAFYDTSFDSVTDILGSQIEFLDFVAADGQKSYTAGTHTIEWSPKDNEDVISAVYRDGTNTITGWENNICQLVYRVRLRTEDTGFDSCAEHLGSKQASIDAGESYAVNRNAMLQYHFEPLPGAAISASDGMTAVYPVPEVRGTLYDIRFSKVNEYGRGLSGAVFGLFEEDGTTPVLDSDGNAWTITTTAGEPSEFVDLPSGTYFLKELKPPAYYNAGSESSWTIPLCYTDDQTMNSLKLDEIDGQNLRYKARDNANGRWEIVNQRGNLSYKINLLKLGRSADGTEKPLSNVEFSISDPDGAEPLIQNTDKNGVLSIDKQFVPGIEYVITELTQPNGYNSLPAPIKFKVIDDKENDAITAELVNEAELAGYVTIQVETQEDGTAVLNLMVYNDAGYELPETGGIGTAPFTLCGLAVLFAGVTIATIRLKRRRERREI